MTMSSTAKNILENMLTRLGFDADVEETPMDSGSLLNVKTEDDPGRLIGRQGRTLSDSNTSPTACSSCRTKRPQRSPWMLATIALKIRKTS